MKFAKTYAVISAVSLIVSSGAIAASATGAHQSGATSTAPASALAKQQTAQSTTTPGPAKRGQPNQSCQATPNTPGSSASAPGSAFNPDGKAGTVYAGQQPQNSRNAASVSQYDVACANQPSK
jgi:hypothetical protein